MKNEPESKLWTAIERLILLEKDEETITELKPHIEECQDAFQEYLFQYETMMKIIGMVNDLFIQDQDFKLTFSKWMIIQEAF